MHHTENASAGVWLKLGALVRDVLRLKLEAQLTHEQTAAALDISKGVITKYLTLATGAGLDWPQIQALDDTALHNRLLGTPQRASGFVQPDPEHGYRACLGLLALAKRFGKPRLEAACVVALDLGTTNSTHVREILINGRDQVQPSTALEWTSPAHAHVRGPGYYQ